MHERHGATVGGKQDRLYTIWRGMIQRCGNPKHDSYPYYGGRGVRLCQQWRESFSVFRAWAFESGYRPGKTIDRIDNDGPYSPENCRWATIKQQARNKGEAANHLIVEHNGKRMSLLAWSRATGIGYTTLVKRYHAGDRGAKLFREPRMHRDMRVAAMLERRNGNAKLTDAQVAEILSSGETGRQLSRRLHVSEALVSMIRSGQRRLLQAG